MVDEIKPPPDNTGTTLRGLIGKIGDAASAARKHIADIMDKGKDGKGEIDTPDLIDAQLTMNVFTQIAETGASTVSAANSANQSPTRGIKGQ